MNHSIFTILLMILLIGCSKHAKNDEPFAIDCDELEAALVSINSEQLNFEINKLTQDLLPSPTQHDEIGHADNLNTLVDRINSNCPQLRATTECYACVETIPVQSEIKVVFDSLGNQIESIIDISTPRDGILVSLRSHTTNAP